MAYTDIDDPSAYFQTAIYTGGGGNSSITNDGNSDLKPDLVWFATRSATNNKPLLDSTRGGNKFIYSDLSQGADTGDSGVGIATFNTDGFTFGSTEQTYFNDTNKTYVAWQWKANGGTTASNTTGDINTTTQVNSDAGFSIVTYTGNGGTNQTVGHGLGVAPQVIIVKNREVSANWIVYHHKIGTSQYLYLDSAQGAADSSNIWGSSAPSSTTFTVQQHNEYNDSGEGLVAYCFAEKQGYSKFGSYVGNGVANNGPFVYLGFKPAFVMIKSTTATGAHIMWDLKRSPFNLMDDIINAAEADAESSNGIYGMDALSNGFKIKNTGTNNGTNQSGTKYVYYAFAENPFTTSTGIPTTAR